jgi:hypothetical protein
VKSKDSVRICGDFKITINQVMEDFTYPLPRIEDIFATLSGGKQFTKIDLKQAYTQMEIHPDFRKFVTINTSKGLYQYNRLPYGIKTAPSQWQQAIENVLQGIPGVKVMLDDIIITGETEEIHIQRLEQVLQRLKREISKLTKRSVNSLKTVYNTVGTLSIKRGYIKCQRK